MDIETVQGKKVDVADVSTVSLRDMYMRICACRDFEISHVWHRAIFLTAFLLGCFTAYGFIAGQLLKDGHLCFARAANAVSFLVALIGVVISILWIMMAKGSKAWYELYEEALGAFATSCVGGDDSSFKDLVGCDWKQLVRRAKIIEHDISWGLFDTNGGPYSVSRINIAIGQISFVIWCGLALVHGIFAIVSEWNMRSDLILKLLFLLYPVGMIIAVAACAIGVYRFAKKQWLRSGYLTRENGK